MFLEAENSPTIESPDEEAIERALHRLTARRVAWIALSTDRRRSSAVSACLGNQWLILECVDDRVRQCCREVPPEIVLAAFKAFARGERSWRMELRWCDVTRDGWWVYLLLAAASMWILWVFWPYVAMTLRWLGLR